MTTATNPVEQAFTFTCGDDPAELIGILHRSTDSTAAVQPARGVLIIVGGPQYRVGSHRQFTLLARALAAAGVPVLRFDYRSMGDADGATRDFNTVNADISAAIDAFCQHCPGLHEVVLWGLCDAASAALFYAGETLDQRVTGLVLLNPWVRTEAGMAKAYLKNYYLQRLTDPALWQKIRRGKFNLKASLGSLAKLAQTALKWRSNAEQDQNPTAVHTQTTPEVRPLPERMADGLARCQQPVLFILSGRDLTAAEFKNLTNTSKHWHRLLSAERVSRIDMADADHTFSRRAWRDQVTQHTLSWLQQQSQ